MRVGQGKADMHRAATARACMRRRVDDWWHYTGAPEALRMPTTAASSHITENNHHLLPLHDSPFTTPMKESTRARESGDFVGVAQILPTETDVRPVHKAILVLTQL